jgi:hypothetical protein
MALVINLSQGQQFNIGHRRFRIEQVNPNHGCSVTELGGSQYSVCFDVPTIVDSTITLQEGVRQHVNSVRLMIEAPKTCRIWRGSYEYDTSVALLAPIPEEHLFSGQECCVERGRVAFGSRDFLVFRDLDERLSGSHCQVLIYASWSSSQGPARVTWTATYLRCVDARSDGSPPSNVFRPESTLKYPADNKGHWAVYWEVTDLKKLEKEDVLPVSLLRGIGAKKTYLKTFRPERPLIIEAL